MLDNLKCAREARQQKIQQNAVPVDAKKYPKGEKRQKAEERNLKVLDLLAEKKGQEILEQKEKERQMQEFEEWKKSQSESVSTPPSKSKKQPKPKETAKPKRDIVKNAIRKSARPRTKSQSVQDPEQESPMSYLNFDGYNSGGSTWNIDD
ncbi:hypothetical protein HK104_006400, partial [Borealophlyctis nickersoniae]